MAASSPANPSNAFDLKSASLALVALVLRTTRLDELEAQFEARIAPSADFFNRDPVVIDLAHVRDQVEPVDFAGLATLLRRYSMVPVAVRSGSPEQLEAALEAGLCEAPDSGADLPHARVAPPPEPVVPEPEPEPVAPIETAADAADAHTSSQDEPAVPVPTLLVVDRPLRSGQQVYAKNADLVVLALVSHGAEVIADGSIHVYAPLRGKAIAGATGDISARIFSTCMEPELISVAGIYQTTDPPLPVEVRGKAAQVRLDGDTLVIEAIKA
ncbi:septum site-determining protein MinC [Sphaerotilus natans]|uniref:septum site-determining protein MinC n=1 Tax=Sphaerotilus natans TaxID=34103 RepID=UPI00406BEFA7